MSSLDGAVTMMTGLPEDVSAEFGSSFGSKEAIIWWGAHVQKFRVNNGSKCQGF